MSERAARLKLLARDKEDLEVVSALMQDALVARENLRFSPEDKRFDLLAYRFCWEQLPESGQQKPPSSLQEDARFESLSSEALKNSCLRRQTGLSLEEVIKVEQKGLDDFLVKGKLAKHERRGFLNLLSLELEGDESTPQWLVLTFSNPKDQDTRALRLQISNLVLKLHDLSSPWPTPWQPAHEIPGN